MGWMTWHRGSCQHGCSILSCSRIARFGSAYFVVARGRKACPLRPPQHGGRAISDARSCCSDGRSLASCWMLSGESAGKSN